MPGIIAEQSLKKLKQQLEEGPRKSRIVDYPLLEALVQTAGERLRLQPILSAALHWYAAVGVATNTPEGQRAQAVVDVEERLAALHDTIRTELDFQRIQTVPAAPIKMTSLPGLGGVPYTPLKAPGDNDERSRD